MPSSVFRPRSTRGARRIGAWLLAAWAVAAAAPAARLPVSEPAAARDAPGGRVKCLARDSTGLLWLCASGGLGRFDGRRVRVYTTRDGLPESSINHFLESRNGTYWVATNGGGVVRFAAGEAAASGRLFDAVPVAGAAGGSELVNVLFEDARGRIWAGTDAGLYVAGADELEQRANSGTGDSPFRALPLGPDPARLQQVWSLVGGTDGVEWIGTSHGLVRLLPDGSTRRFTVASSGGTDHVMALHVDEERGLLWIGHETGLLVLRLDGEERAATAPVPLAERAPECVGRDTRWQPGPWRVCRWRHPAGVPGFTAVTALLAGAGGLWIGGSAGLAFFDGDGFRVYEPADGLGGNIESLALDGAGNLWMGTSDRGIARLARSGFVTYALHDQPAAARIQALIDDGGRVLVVTLDGQVHALERDRFRAYPIATPRDAAGSGAVRVNAVRRDSRGEWWLLTARGLARYPAVELAALATSRPLAIYRSDDGLVGDDVRRLFEDRHGDLWIAPRLVGEETLAVLERQGSRVRRYGVGDGLPAGNPPSAFAEDPAGGIWIGFFHGLVARQRDGTFVVLDEGDGLPAGAISSLLADSRGRIWIGSSAGLFRVDEPSAPRPRIVEPVGAMRGLAIGALAEDRYGRLYAATSTELLRIDPTTGAIERFGDALGMPRGVIVALQADGAGDVWAASWYEVGRLRPEPPAPIEPAAVRIAEIAVGGEQLPVPELGATALPPLRLGPGRAHVRVRFFALGPSLGDPVRFQTRLRGAEEDWSAETEDDERDYAALAPGRYRFEVRGVTAGAIASRPATVTFTVLPPMWRRGWFLASTAALVAWLAFLAHRARLEQRLALERMRTRVAADLHDDLGASLARISVLSEVTRRQVASRSPESERLLATIGESARSLLESTRDIVWAIDPRQDDLASLIVRLRRFAGDLLEGHDVSWELALDDATLEHELPADQRRQLLLIFQEALHNVARHARASRIRVGLRREGRRLIGEVSDDGRGFDPDDLAGFAGLPPAGENEATKGGQGLENMRRRARVLGGELAVRSRPGGGTTIRLEVPFP